MNSINTIKKIKTTLKQPQKKAVEKVCSCRIPEEDYREINEEILQLGYKNMSHYFREILTSRKREANDSELVQYKNFLITKISNNVNQIAKAINTDLKTHGTINYEKTNSLLEKQLQELYSLIE
ncbi:MAG: plasmid mobilization relaxosome protein MobC [Campylobacterota bacterium]|nr:plasmid mobilization relaxosome protein MobC [Campylobacterota bacterium]